MTTTHHDTLTTLAALIERLEDLHRSMWDRHIAQVALEHEIAALHDLFAQMSAEAGWLVRRQTATLCAV